MINVDWEPRIRGWAKDHDMSFGAAMSYLAKRDSVEVAANLLGVANGGEYQNISNTLDGLAKFFDKHGCTPPKKWHTANNYVLGNAASKAEIAKPAPVKESNPKIALSSEVPMTVERFLALRAAGYSKRAISKVYPELNAHIGRWELLTPSKEKRVIEHYMATGEVKLKFPRRNNNLPNRQTKVAETTKNPADERKIAKQEKEAAIVETASTQDQSVHAPQAEEYVHMHYSVEKSNVVPLPTPRKQISLTLTLDDMLMRKSIEAIMEDVHQIAIDKGWHDGDPHLPTQLLLITGEVSEAMEADRRFEGPERIAEELADVVIRSFDTAASHGLDLVGAIFEKIEVNRTREQRHGGKKY